MTIVVTGNESAEFLHYDLSRDDTCHDRWQNSSRISANHIALIISDYHIRYVIHASLMLLQDIELNQLIILDSSCTDTSTYVGIRVSIADTYFTDMWITVNACFVGMLLIADSFFYRHISNSRFSVSPIDDNSGFLFYWQSIGSKNSLYLI